MKTVICIPLFLLILCTATVSIPVAAPAPSPVTEEAEPNLDLQTLIAGIKHFDAMVSSGQGEFIYEHKMGAYKDKRTYDFTFDGITFEEAQVGVNYYSPTLYDSLAEIYDGERQWEIYEGKETLFSVDISAADHERLSKEKPELPPLVKQELKVHNISISDDFRIETEDENSYSKMIDNVTGHSHYIYYTEEYFSVYTTVLNYGVRSGCVIHAHLDPRYWMTFGEISLSGYLMTPLWRVLETYQSEILRTEILNGEETYLVHVKHPYTKSLKLWISPKKGFRLVKLQKIFKAQGESKRNTPIKSGVHYLVERVLHYQEYLPGIWFPEKVEETVHPLFAADLEKKGDLIGRTTLQAVTCELNTDVSGRFQLDVPEETLVFDYAVGKKRSLRELKQTSQ